MPDAERAMAARACQPPGLAGRLAPEVAAGLEALTRVARALSGTGGLAELAERALRELRTVLRFDAAVLYLPDGERPALHLHVASPDAAGPPRARQELALDAEAWELAVAGGHPLVFGERGGWLLDNPFEPPAEHWVVLPLVAAGRLVGVAMAARGVPVDLDATTLTVLSLLSDQLSAGIATARLRQELQRTALERERLRLAAELHDGLAQDLALAARELALLADPELDAEVAAASFGRLRAAVDEAHELVRARLGDLTATPPIDGVAAVVREACKRYARLGLPVEADLAERVPQLQPAAAVAVDRVLGEALANAHRHARPRHVRVRLAVEGARLLLAVSDDGRGFDPGVAPGREGRHLGLALMRERAREVGARLQVDSRAGHGTTVALSVPLDAVREAP